VRGEERKKSGVQITLKIGDETDTFTCEEGVTIGDIWDLAHRKLKGETFRLVSSGCAIAEPGELAPAIREFRLLDLGFSRTSIVHVVPTIIRRSRSGEGLSGSPNATSRNGKRRGANEGGISFGNRNIVANQYNNNNNNNDDRAQSYSRPHHHHHHHHDPNTSVREKKKSISGEFRPQPSVNKHGIGSKHKEKRHGAGRKKEDEEKKTEDRKETAPASLDLDMEKKHARLVEMGYADWDLNEILLTNTQGNLPLVVDWLTRNIKPDKKQTNKSWASRV